MATLKTYIVKNPRGIPSGVHIIDVAGTRLYEGDEWKETTTFVKDGTVEWLLGQHDPPEDYDETVSGPWNPPVYIEVKPNG